MKIFYSIFFIITLLSGTVYAGEEKHQIFVSFINGQLVSYELPLNKISSQPKWDGIGEPPMSISTATKMAIERIRAEMVGAVISVTDIGLKRKITNCVNVTCKVDYWYYTIILKLASPHERVKNKDKRKYVILLDGTVIEPTFKDEATY